MAFKRKRKRVNNKAAIKKQVDNNIKYIDLFLVYILYRGLNIKKERKEIWLILERAFKKGRVWVIGVSNYKVKHLEEMREYAKV